jgi:hypothetical protein
MPILVFILVLVSLPDWHADDLADPVVRAEFLEAAVPAALQPSDLYDAEALGKECPSPKEIRERADGYGRTARPSGLVAGVVGTVARALFLVYHCLRL